MAGSIPSRGSRSGWDWPMCPPNSRCCAHKPLRISVADLDHCLHQIRLLAQQRELGGHIGQSHPDRDPRLGIDPAILDHANDAGKIMAAIAAGELTVLASRN